MAGMRSRSSAGSCDGRVLRVPGADVPSAPGLRNRRALSSDRAPRWVFRVRDDLGGAPAVASVKCGHEPALLGHRLGLLWR